MLLKSLILKGLSKELSLGGRPGGGLIGLFSGKQIG